MAENIRGYTTDKDDAEIAAQRIVIAALSSGAIRLSYDVANNTVAMQTGQLLGLITTTLAQTLSESKKA